MQDCKTLRKKAAELFSYIYEVRKNIFIAGAIFGGQRIYSTVYKIGAFQDKKLCCMV